MLAAVKPIQQSRVAIVGGSIGGCAAAIALQRARVASVDVFERSSANALADRGLGIGLPHPVFAQLVEKDMVDPNMRHVVTEKRHWILKNDDDDEGDDGTTSYLGKILYAPEMNIQLHNWGLLWQKV